MKFSLDFRIRPKFFIGLVIVLLSIWVVCSQPIFFNFSRPKGVLKASPETLKAHVKKISEEFFPRDYESIENLNLVASYLEKQFRQSSSSVTVQKYTADGREYRNVIAKFGPETKRVVVVGAHYDSSEKYPAADDNASGVAGLLELSRILKKNSLKNIQVQIVAYSTEEPPYFGFNQMGSYVHAESLYSENLEVLGMLSLEMIGYFSDEWGSQGFPAFLMRLFYPSKGNFVAIVSDFSSYSLTKKVKGAMQLATDLPIYSMNGPQMLYGIDYSDHRNYWKFGFPAVMVSDTAFFRNKNYHTQNDTSEKLDYSKMAKVIDGIQEVIFQMDEF